MDKHDIFKNEYMPYIIKWGKITCWLAIPIVFIPAFVLFFVFGARPPMEGIITGLVTSISSTIAWYVVDPVSLFPILGVAGLYMTYISGNSKEIRAPAAMQAMEAAGVEGGTDEGTVISSLGIATSVFISIAVMTVIAIAGQAVLDILPPIVLKAFNYLVPSLFGGLLFQRLMTTTPKLILFCIPFVVLLKVLNLNGIFKILPLGGAYAQILLSVAGCMLMARYIFEKSNPKMKDKAEEEKGVGR